MIAIYDLDDNLITTFDNYKQCAEYFNTSIGVIRSHLCRAKQGKTDKKRDLVHKNWCRLYKIEEEE